MTDLQSPRPKRKVLSLKLEKVSRYKDDFPERFVDREQGAVMVWREGGDMPKRMYKPDEIRLAIRHAQELAMKTGERFHILRSWRAFDAVENEE